jgi:hypothetical protein
MKTVLSADLEAVSPDREFVFLLKSNEWVSVVTSVWHKFALSFRLSSEQKAQSCEMACDYNSYLLKTMTRELGGDRADCPSRESE